MISVREWLGSPCSGPTAPGCSGTWRPRGRGSRSWTCGPAPLSWRADSGRTAWSSHWTDTRPGQSLATGNFPQASRPAEIPPHICNKIQCWNIFLFFISYYVHTNSIISMTWLKLKNKIILSRTTYKILRYDLFKLCLIVWLSNVTHKSLPVHLAPVEAAVG